LPGVPRGPSHPRPSWPRPQPARAVAETARPFPSATCAHRPSGRRVPSPSPVTPPPPPHPGVDSTIEGAAEKRTSGTGTPCGISWVCARSGRSDSINRRREASMTDPTTAMLEAKAALELETAKAAAAKAQRELVEAESPLAKAKREAEAQKGIDQAHQQSAEAQQKQASALIPDLSKVTPSSLEVKG